MAEIVVLVIFSLLLALAAALASREQRIRDLERLIGETHKVTLIISALQERYPQAQTFDDLFIELKAALESSSRHGRLVSALQEQFPRANTPDELIRELNTAIARVGESERLRRELEQARADLNELTPLIQEVTQAAKKGGISRADLVKYAAVGQALSKELSGDVDASPASLAADVVLGREVRAAAAKAKVDQPQKLIEIATRAAQAGDPAVRLGELEREVVTLRGQIGNLRAKLGELGRGTEMPACWASAETGRPEYIFDVALKSGTFIIRDRKIPHRKKDQAALPLHGIVFDQEIGPDVFLNQTEPLYAWSVKHECRFFVRAFDLTGAAEKEAFKRQMRILEGRFYKLEVLSERFN